MISNFKKTRNVKILYKITTTKARSKQNVLTEENISNLRKKIKRKICGEYNRAHVSPYL